MTPLHAPPLPECPVLVEAAVTGELDLMSEIGVVLDRILSLRPKEVVIDLSECRHIDAAAIGLLIDLHRTMARRNGVLAMRNASPRIRRVPGTVRVDHVLPIVDANARWSRVAAREDPATNGPGGAPVARGRAKATTRP